MTDRPRPKYIEIANALRHAITDAQIGPGDFLPSENVLSARYNVTRVTVSRALGVLRDEGLIATGRGRGSWVRRTGPRRYLGPDRYRPLAGRGEASSLQLIGGDRQPVPGDTHSLTSQVAAGQLRPRLNKWLGLGDDTPLVRRDAAFRVDDVGEQVWTSWLPYDAVQGSPLGEAGTDPWAGTTIAHYAQLGWIFDHALEHVSARMPDEDTAIQLGITTDVPIMLVERVMYFIGPGAATPSPLEVALVTLPGDSTVLVNRIAAG